MMPPGNELNLAERRAATRRQAVKRNSHRRNRLDGAFVFNLKEWSAGEARAGRSFIDTVAEKSNRALVIRMISISVQCGVKLGARREQAQQPNRQRTKYRNPAQSRSWLWLHAGNGHVAKEIRIGRRSRVGWCDR